MRMNRKSFITLAAGTAGVYVVYEPAHIVLSVPPGGETYSLSFLDARDEKMTVKSVINCESVHG